LQEFLLNLLKILRKIWIKNNIHVWLGNMI
jgi:hypothetical protein